MAMHTTESGQQAPPVHQPKVVAPTVSDKGRELGQHIRDLYASGAKLWTKAAILQLETQLRESPGLDSYPIRYMDGVERAEPWPDLPCRPSGTVGRVGTDFTIYQHLVHAAETIDDADMSGSDDELKQQLLRSYSLVYSYRYSHEDAEVPGYSDVKRMWAEARTNWQQSPACEELRAVFQGCQSLPKVTRIVCLGLGSFEVAVTRVDNDEEAGLDGLPLRRSMTQHAAAITVAEVLGKQLPGARPVIMAQDPAYSALAKRILKEDGIEVIDGYGSLAFTLIDEETLVFSCCPNIPVKQIVADIARPAAMIWDRVKPESEERSEWEVINQDGSEVLISPWLTDEDSPRTRKLVQGYSKHYFRASNERFGDMEIFIRKD
ncbi:hypothetical protein S40288_10820 [Stachybotrys chartarum IBT 40288]|nr:hypothetical protein S40288_10820 [Stachybotrys chartarum IBT 40288]